MCRGVLKALLDRLDIDTCLYIIYNIPLTGLTPILDEYDGILLQKTGVKQVLGMYINYADAHNAP